MTTCREGCGACCDPVMLGDTHLAQSRLNITDRDRRWFLEDLRAMPGKEAAAKTAWMRASGRRTVGFVDGRMTRDAFFYSCRHFDPVARTCASHDDLPSACSGYPWHGEPRPDAAIPPECSFNADVGRVPVAITPRSTRGGATAIGCGSQPGG